MKQGRNLAVFVAFSLIAVARAHTPPGIVTQVQPRHVVMTRLVPLGEPRPRDGWLLFLVAKGSLSATAPDVVVHDGKGPSAAIWIIGNYRREEGGRFRIEISAGRPGQAWRTAVAVGTPAAALGECFCSVGLVLHCGGLP